MEHFQRRRFIGGEFLQGGLKIERVWVVRERLRIRKLRNVIMRGWESELGESSDHHTSGDDSEIGSQGAISSKASEGGEVFFDPRQEYLSYEIIARVSRDLNVAGGSGVVYDVDDESQEPVGEFLPSGRVFCKALVEQIAIEIG